MLEKQLLNEFEQFSKRRLANKYNIENAKVWENFIFSSCGDEFFRNEEMLEEIIKNSNLSRYEKYANLSESEQFMIPEEDDIHNPIIIGKSSYYEGFFGIHRDKARKKNEVNVIYFGACRINKIPFISTKVQLNESFSTHTDFHAMLYNDQMWNLEIEYIWILFKWFRINKKVESY